MLRFSFIARDFVDPTEQLVLNTYLMLLLTITICSETFDEEQGWHSGESARLSPKWPGSISARCHTWVEFVVGSQPCSGGFSRDSPGFLPAQKPTSPNSNTTRIDDPHDNQLGLT